MRLLILSFFLSIAFSTQILAEGKLLSVGKYVGSASQGTTCTLGISFRKKEDTARKEEGSYTFETIFSDTGALDEDAMNRVVFMGESKIEPQIKMGNIFKASASTRADIRGGIAIESLAILLDFDDAPVLYKVESSTLSETSTLTRSEFICSNLKKVE